MDKINLKEFVPNEVICSDGKGPSYPLEILEHGNFLHIRYTVDIFNHTGKCGKRSYHTFLPSSVSRSLETFEVLGLLQGEMNKKYDGKITFPNHEPRLVSKVVKWFETELNFPFDQWKWYIKVNINEPSDPRYTSEVQDKVVSYWTQHLGLSLEMAYPKQVSYIKNTHHKKLKNSDFGTLIVERRSNVFSHIIKKLVKDITNNVTSFKDEEIRSYMKGIFAAESCVEVHLQSKKYRVHISAKDPAEKLIFHNCLTVLGIQSIIYKYDKLVVSKKQNNLELQRQGLMELSPEKHAKFQHMMGLYVARDFHCSGPKPLIMACSDGGILC